MRRVSWFALTIPDESTASIAKAIDIYNLTKYQRSNQNTCINQKPIVVEGDRSSAGR